MISYSLRALLLLTSLPRATALRPAGLLSKENAALVAKKFAATACALALSNAPCLAAETTQGFSELASEGKVMQANPSCFMNECGEQSKACFSNPACLKGVTCLGNCRGEQLCATRCFARFGSERLNNWLACTLEDKQCVTSGVEQDVSQWYADAPRRVEEFEARELEGKWWKVAGVSDKYDCFACQVNTFSSPKAKQVTNDIEFRVPKLGGAAEGFWQNNMIETLVDERGPAGKASLTVEGKMYGLTFHENWYILGSSATTPNAKNLPEHVFVAYKGDTLQGPYEGGFVYARDKDAWRSSPALREAIGRVAEANGIKPSAGFCNIDNTCPTAGVVAAGVSADEAGKEKLAWSDVFALTEWIRPGTLKKDDNFDPSQMR